MSLSPCDFMDAVLNAAANTGAPFPTPHDEDGEEVGDWGNDEFEAAANHVGTLLEQRKALLDALRKLQTGGLLMGIGHERARGEVLTIVAEALALVDGPDSDEEESYRCPVCGEPSAGGFIAHCTPDELPEPGDVRETGR